MNKYRIGTIIPGGSFMPQGVKEVFSDSYLRLFYGFHKVMDCGYDFVEASARMVMAITEDETKKLAENQVRFEVLNCFIPAKYRIVDLDKDLFSFVENVFNRMNILGADTVVFGSGKSRALPDNYDKITGYNKQKEFLMRCAEIAQNKNVTVVVEPLSYDESNIFNTLDEGAEIVRDVNCPSIKLLADIYHLYNNGEKADTLLKNADILSHIHICNPVKRLCPTDKIDDYLTEFAQCLKSTDYDGRLTIECDFLDYDNDISKGIKLMRDLF